MRLSLALIAGGALCVGCTFDRSGTDGVVPSDADAAPGDPPDAAGAVPDATVLPPDADNSGVTSFRQGVNGYNGCVDTYVDLFAPEVAFGTVEQLTFDADNFDNPEKVPLIRFESMFGDTVNQIPVGATISSAHLELQITDLSVPPDALVYEAASGWNENTTWNTLGATAGFDAEDHAPNSLTNLPATLLGPTDVDLTSSLQALSTGGDNVGWVVRPSNGNRGSFVSCDALISDLRPKLTVSWSVTN